MIIKMITEVRRLVHEQSENFNMEKYFKIPNKL